MHSETITLPKGCDIYALLVSGHGRNLDLNELSFYNLAKFVAENNGYVHYAWWNNLLKPYMGGPLHDAASTPEGEFGALGSYIPRFIDITKGRPNDDYQFQADARAFLQAIRDNHPVNQQPIVILVGHSMGGGAVSSLAARTSLVIDLLALLEPTGNRSLPEGIAAPLVGDIIGCALGLVGGPAGCLLGFLLGQLIDRPASRTVNFTRWRGTRIASGTAAIDGEEFAGWTQRNCVRGSLGIFCKNFGTFFKPKYICFNEPTWSPTPPLFASLAPVKCPATKKDVHDLGRQRSFGANVRRLYYRWQTEAFPPTDHDEAHFFGHSAPRSNNILSANYQQPVLENARDEQDPRKTCRFISEQDPLDPNLSCHGNDGHGEIVGTRGLGGNQNLQGVLATGAWPQPDLVGCELNQPFCPRRAAFIQMAGFKEFPRKFFDDVTGAAIHTVPCTNTAEGCWPHRPQNPDLCIVCSDLVQIVEDILLVGDPDQPDLGAPTSTAHVIPSPNQNGWNDQDVLVTLNHSGRSLPLFGGLPIFQTQIEYTLSGAQTQPPTNVGDGGQFAITNNGSTIVTFFAHRDGIFFPFEETPHNSLAVQVDKIPPVIEATVSPEPNSNGWNNSAVTVSFFAEDEPSGVAAVSEPIIVTSEGANQEIIGNALDLAGNQSAAGALLNIDTTAPELLGLPQPGCTIWPLDKRLVKVADVAASDALSGVSSTSISVTSDESPRRGGKGDAQDVLVDGGQVWLRADRAGAGVGRTYTITASVSDLAGNNTTRTSTCSVPHDQRAKNR
jgi:pimeloyl-ACP methyl ester carboxylesterase